MKKLIFTLSVLLITAVPIFAQEGADKSNEDSSSIGITVAAEYWSNYLWRGTPWYQGDGAFFPSISYDVMNSGLEISVVAEISEGWIFDGDDTVKDLHAIDAGIGYEYTFADIVTAGVSLWYYRLKDNDFSFANASVSLTLETFLSPTVSYTHDYYFESKAKKDFYIQLGISHEFTLTDEAAVELSLIGGYYNADSTNQKGISDIQFGVSPSIEVGGVSFFSGLYLVYVPSGDFEVPGDDLRFNASFGSSYSF